MRSQPALAMVAEEIPAPVGTEFRLLYDRQNYGMPVDEAMKDLAERIPLLDARFFVTAVLMQRETGGNLAEVLDNLSTGHSGAVPSQTSGPGSDGARPDHGIRPCRISPSPRRGHVRHVARPPQYVMVEDPLGIQMIIGAVTLQIVGTLIIRKLVNIEY